MDHGGLDVVRFREGLAANGASASATAGGESGFGGGKYMPLAVSGARHPSGDPVSSELNPMSQKAVADLVAAEHAGGDEASLWLYTLGRLLYDQSELEEASEKLKEALGRPGAPPACKPLLRHAQRLETERTAGNNAFKRGDWAGAVDAYTRALQVDAGHARFNALLYCNRAAAHAKKGLLSQAIADCSASIALDGAYAKAYLRRGELRQQCGDAPRASSIETLITSLDSRARPCSSKLESIFSFCNSFWSASRSSGFDASSSSKWSPA